MEAQENAAIISNTWRMRAKDPKRYSLSSSSWRIMEWEAEYTKFQLETPSKKRYIPPKKVKNKKGPDTTNFICKGCADHKVLYPSGIYSQNLKSLFSSLFSQASQKSFTATTSSNGGGGCGGGRGTVITRVYQCRGDLINLDCDTCVCKILDMLGKLCGADMTAMRVQLSGCYLLY
ncbi:hypothetical protein TanjilG_27245 [Lupinus angustifolius]|uniref:Gnk2-homologous domain-containing protein n=1 Tax=Lupinus angustifolius TaxID=3871 RepID=A0A1J7GVC9_LUPAN|nr:hypothetical protein TanjilG_27245 [Lupinus angustifolius]